MEFMGQVLNEQRLNKERSQPKVGNQLAPPLKWAGGKRWLVPHLQPYWLAFTHYRLVDPFCGGLAVTLGLNPESALLNDINPHAINFYQWLAHGLKTNIRMENDSDTYYAYRSEFNQIVTGSNPWTKRAAELFYYLNRTGYNGLCRFNNKGEFNVPFGRYKKINYTRDFTAYKPILGNWRFSSVDFEQISLSSNDFVYADPPYDVEFTQYAKGGFDWDDQVRLAKWLAAHPGPVVASNQATERITDLYSELNFEISILSAPRMISCTGDRTKAREVLAFKRPG